LFHFVSALQQLAGKRSKSNFSTAARRRRLQQYAQIKAVNCLQGGATMKRTSLGVIGIAAFFLAAQLSAASAADMPTKAPPPAAAQTSSPAPCGSLWDFVATACPLTWYGVTLYGTIDVGGG
jgi:hypothetical protein